MKHLFKVSGYGVISTIRQSINFESTDPIRSINPYENQNLFGEETLLILKRILFFFKRDLYERTLFINIHNIAQPCNYVKRRYATRMHSNIQRIYT